MNEGLRIYVDRLRTQGVERIQESVSPDFMGVQEKELRFLDLVEVTGECYLADSELVLKLMAATKAEMPCAICNQPVAVPMEAEILHMVPLAEIKHGIFDIGETIREALLLELPLVAECNQGKCPGRAELEQYLRMKKQSGREEDQGFRPFADLDLKE